MARRALGRGNEKTLILCSSPPLKSPFTILQLPKIWFLLFLLWLTVLSVASSLNTQLPEETPKIPHLDKIAHFTYFLGGAVIFNTWLLLKHGRNSPPYVRFLIPMVLFGVFGAIDEYRQTFTPGRSGNDPYDWLADILGALTGILSANLFHPLLLKFSSPKPSLIEN